MGQKIKDIIRSRNTHTHAVCLCPYMGRFIPEAWRASALTILFYAQLLLLCVGVFTLGARVRVRGLAIWRITVKILTACYRQCAKCGGLYVSERWGR